MSRIYEKRGYIQLSRWAENTTLVTMGDADDESEGYAIYLSDDALQRLLDRAEEILWGGDNDDEDQAEVDRADALMFADY